MDLLASLELSPVNAGAYSGHGWQSEEKGDSFGSVNPATGEVIARVANVDLNDYSFMLSRQERAFAQWRHYPAPKRGEIVRQIAELLRKNKEALGELVSLESGKSRQEGYGEVQEMIDMADFAVGLSRMLYGRTMHSERAFHRLYEQWHPYGIVGVISAFNFPVAVWAWNAFIAAVCGNVTVWKPSTKTPLSAIAVQKLCNRVLSANDCPEIFSLVIAEKKAVVEAMVNDRKIPLLSFTGSTKTGRQVAAAVAARLGKTILELGGNNAVIVDETADLSLAIPAIVFGAVGTAGQRCTSTRRLFLHESRYDEVLHQLKKAYKQITVGDPLDPKNLMGPLIDIDAQHAFTKAITRIKDQGGNIAFGGNILPGPGYFVQPTLVTEIKPDWDIVQEETFAPILYVMPYSKLEQALVLQNAVPQGLSSALFTQNLLHSEAFLSAAGSDCGIANINVGTSGAEIGGAFGGEKESGGGREAGSDAWKAYMRRQTITVNWGQDLPLAQGIQFDLGKEI